VSDTDPDSGIGSTVTAELWVDPACPWAWLTSRWLTEVQQVRPVAVRWHVMSLGVIHEAEEIPPQWQEANRRSWAAVRLLTAAQAAGGEGVVEPLYTAIARRIHVDGRVGDDGLLAEAVAEVGLDPALLDHVHDATHDAALRADHERAIALVGDDVGTPVLAIDGRGIFGPVVSPAPVGEAAGQVWDAVQTLLGVGGFFELKRTRDRPPAVA